MLRQGRKKILKNRKTRSFCVEEEMDQRLRKAQQYLTQEAGEPVSFSEVIRRAVNIAYPDNQFDLFGDKIKRKSV